MRREKVAFYSPNHSAKYQRLCERGASIIQKIFVCFGGLIAFNILVKHTNKHSFLLLLQMKPQREQKASNWTNLGL